MRRRLSTGIVLVGVLALTSFSTGDDKPAKKAKFDYEKAAAGGPGVSNVVRDKKGRILSVLIVGRSRLSTVLGAAKGQEVAAQRASLMADARFVQRLRRQRAGHQN